MPADLSTYDEALKDDYTIGLRNAINNSNVVLTEVSRNRAEIIGRKALWSAHVGRSTGTGARAEGGTLPTAGNQDFEDPSQSLKFLYHTVKVSGPALELTRGDKGAFLRALDAEMRGGEKDLKNDTARQIFGRLTVKDATPTVGRTGTVAVCGTTTASTTVVLATATTKAEMRYFFVNMLIDIIDTNDGSALASSRSITAIDKVNKTITISGAAVTTDSTHIVVRQGNYDNEILGLRALINDNTGDKVDGSNTVLIHNVSSSTVPAWAAVKVGSSTTPVSENIFDEAFDTVLTDGDGEEPSLVLGSYEQRRALSNKLQMAKRYEGKEVTLKSGWRGLSLARGTYVAERFCPDNDAFAINPSELEWAVGKDFSFDDTDGRVLLRALDGSDAFEARMKAYVQLLAPNRNSHCRIQLQAL